MTLGSIIVFALVGMAVVAAAIFLVRDRRSGKCCGGCADCGNCCHRNVVIDEEE